jgi:hypothetical protein
MNGEEALTQQAQTRLVARFDELAAEQIEPVEAGRAQELLELRLADRRLGECACG